MAASVRRPVVAGSFYSASPSSLRAQVMGCVDHILGPRAPALEIEQRLVGGIAPHAGFFYSGAAAAWTWAAVAAQKPEVVFLLGPNHYGLGERVAVSGAQSWSTPLGEVPVDTGACQLLQEAFDLARLDDSAHSREHCLEVQLPFLQVLVGDVPIVPICILSGRSLAADGARDLRIEELGQALAHVARGRRALFLASSDWTHYESRASASRKDTAALAEVEALNAAGLLELVDKTNISMCGALPIAAVISAATAAGASSGRLLKYYTSGDITGDDGEVVGYASVIFLS